MTAAEIAAFNAAHEGQWSIAMTASEARKMAARGAQANAQEQYRIAKRYIELAATAGRRWCRHTRWPDGLKARLCDEGYECNRLTNKISW